MTGDIVFVQSFFLAANEATLPAVGTKPFFPARWYTSWRIFLLRMFTIACLGLAVMDTVDVVMYSLALQDEHTPFLIHLVQLLWARFIAARAAMIIWLFSSHIIQWRALRAFVSSKIAPPLNQHNVKRILLVTVGMDVLTALGVCAKLLAAPQSGEIFSPIRWLRYAWVAVTFLIYATICYMPLIWLHEEGMSLQKILRDFVWIMSGYGEQSTHVITIMTTVVTTLLVTREILAA
ncbi:hypothetical protein BV898_17204 [Hypsibius exemplaris]|uniref:Uncharacterized protein n=1 Tax=Hypsibius exemplaris TaxID=2072580 RepID=A0A9X6RMK8_HYPEX|nr:hypothetical protein BV898_17204 [Hypsibius exemplaris]